MYNIMPSDQKSTERSYGSPFKISGEINKGVPQAVVMRQSLEIFANPKSAILSIASWSFVDQSIFSGCIVIILL